MSRNTLGNAELVAVETTRTRPRWIPLASTEWSCPWISGLESEEAAEFEKLKLCGHALISN